jgi:hypothetical protein
LCYGNRGRVEETWRQCPQISSTGRWSWFVGAAPDARCCSRSGARTFEHHTRRALLLHHSPSPLLLWNQLQNPATQCHAMLEPYWLIAGPKQFVSPHFSLVSVIAGRKHPWNDSSICVQHYHGGLSSWLHQEVCQVPS